MAADKFTASDTPHVETNPDTACSTPLDNAVASVADIVASWLNVAIEAAKSDFAETLAAVEPSTTAASGNIVLQSYGLHLW